MIALEQQLSILGVMLVLIVLANIGHYRQSQKRSSENRSGHLQKRIRDGSL